MSFIHPRSRRAVYPLEPQPFVEMVLIASANITKAPAHIMAAFPVGSKSGLTSGECAYNQGHRRGMCEAPERVHRKGQKVNGLKSLRPWAAVGLLWCIAGAWAQSSNGKTPPRQPTRNESLVKPLSWGEFQVRFFKGSHVTMTFRLETSWIPGADHKGLFRYKLSAFPKKPITTAELASDTELNTPEKVESFIRRVKECRIFLGLFDSDGFRLRGIPVAFQLTVNDDGQVEGLYANLDTQMEADEYRMFVGSTSTSGSWSIAYTCENG